MLKRDLSYSLFSISSLHYFVRFIRMMLAGRSTYGHCEPYTGSVCRGIADSVPSIYVPWGTSQAALEAVVCASVHCLLNECIKVKTCLALGRK